MFENIIGAIEEVDNTIEESLDFEEIENEFNKDDTIDALESYEYCYNLHKNLEKSNLDDRNIVSALEESFTYDKNIDKEFITSGLEEKMGLLKRLYLKTITYVQNLINMFKKWFYKAKAWFTKEKLINIDFNLVVEFDKRPYVLTKKHISDLTIKFPGLDFYMVDLDKRIADVLSKSDVTTSFKKGTEDIKPIDIIRVDILDKANEEVLSKAKEGLFGKDFSSNAKIKLVFTTLSYGRFMITEEIDGKAYSKLIKIDYKPIKTISDNSSSKPDLTDLIDALNKITQKDELKKLYDIAYSRNKHILADMRKIIDRAKDDFTKEDKLKLSIMKENVKNSYAIVKDFAVLLNEVSKYIDVKYKIYSEKNKEAAPETNKERNRNIKTVVDKDTLINELVDNKNNLTTKDVIDFIKYNKITTQDARVLELLDKRVPIKAIQHFVDDCTLISTTEADYNYKIKLILGNIKDYKEKTNSIYAKKEIEGIYKEMFIFYNIIKGNFNYFIEDEEIKKLAEENAIKDKQVIYRILYNAFGFRDYTKKLDKTNAKKFLVLSNIFHIHFVKGFGKLKKIDRQILRKNFEISNTRTCLDFFEFEFLNIRYWYPDYSEFKFDLEETFNDIYAKSKPKVTAKDRFKNRKEKLNKIENNDIFSRLDKLENAPSRQIDEFIRFSIKRKIDVDTIIKITQVVHKNYSMVYTTHETSSMLRAFYRDYDTNAFFYKSKRKEVDEFVRLYLFMKENEPNYLLRDISIMILGSNDLNGDLIRKLKANGFDYKKIFSSVTDVIRMYMSARFRELKSLKMFIEDLKNIKLAEDLTNFQVIVD